MKSNNHFINIEVNKAFYMPDFDKETRYMILVPCIAIILIGLIIWILNKWNVTGITINILSYIILFLVFFLLIFGLVRSVWPLFRNKKLNKITDEIKFEVGINWLKKSKILSKEIEKENYKIYGNLEKVKIYFRIKEMKKLIIYIAFISIGVFSLISLIVNHLEFKNYNYLIIIISISIILSTTLLNNLVSKSFPTFFWDKKRHIQSEYAILINKTKKLKLLLNTSMIKNINLQNLEKYDYLPNYFYLIKNEEVLNYELELWRDFLNFSTFFNKICALEIVYWILINNKLKIKSKKWNILKLKLNSIINSLYENEDFNINNFIDSYNDLIFFMEKNIKYSYKFLLILIILKKLNIDFYQKINLEKKISIDDRDSDFNMYQLNYIEYLYSISHKI